MKKILIHTLAVLIFLTSFSQPAFSQNAEKPAERERIKDNNELLKNLDYPELMVVPRASERLNLEAQYENSMGPLMHWTFELSGLSTLAIGLMHKGRYKKEDFTDQQKKDSDNVALTAIGIGAAWLGVAAYYSIREPYQSAATQLKTTRVTDKKSDLLKERLAEEALQRPADEIRLLTNLSVLTNLGASLSVLNEAHESLRYFAIISAFASLTPYLFESRYVENYRKHLEYKRKIYAPLIGYSLNKDLKPVLMAQWSF